MGSKRVGTYKSKSNSYNKNRKRNLQGGVEAHVLIEAAPTKIDQECDLHYGWRGAKSGKSRD